MLFERPVNCSYQLLPLTPLIIRKIGGTMVSGPTQEGLGQPVL